MSWLEGEWGSALSYRECRSWGRLREVGGAEEAQVGVSPPVGVGGRSIVQGRAAFTVGLIGACAGGHQCHRTLVAAIGGCIVQWGPGDIRSGWRGAGNIASNRSKGRPMRCG